jgi:hypothetical protein
MGTCVNGFIATQCCLVIALCNHGRCNRSTELPEVSQEHCYHINMQQGVASLCPCASFLKTSNGFCLNFVSEVYKISHASLVLFLTSPKLYMKMKSSFTFFYKKLFCKIN